MAWTTLCEMDELKEGAGKYVEIDGFQLAVFLHEGKPFVIDNTCPHAGASLAGGYVDAGCAVCPWHGWAFHLDSGELRDAPGVKISCYQTRLLQRENQPAMLQANLPMP